MEYEDTIRKLCSGELNVGLTLNQRKTWPQFGFHFTDIINAVGILSSGQLVSRNYAKAHGMMQNDNASADVIEGTPNDVEDYVRLYFRPKTPTQYYNEGFQVAEERQYYKANCPVPIFFLFDLAKLLSQPDVQFTNRSLAVHREVKRHQTPEEFSRLSFEKIYHNQALQGTKQEQKNIIEHRHAEIIVPNRLGLENLSWILVRSEAERVTFLTLLHEKGITEYDNKIVLGHENFFFGDRNYIQKVELSSTGFQIVSNVNHAFPKDWGTSVAYALNPEATEKYLRFQVRIKFRGVTHIYRWPQDSQYALLQDQIHFTFPDELTPEERDHYIVSVWLDQHIAYKAEHHLYIENWDLPF